MKVNEIDLEKFLKSVLPEPELYEVLITAQNISEKRGEFLYFAGGVVRDYFLKTLYKRKVPKIKDLDLVLQGNLENFLKEFLKKVKGESLFKSQFLTYKVKLDLNGKEFLIDFITARKEIYEDVAKLPKVFPSDFRDDILRRDFTINALLIGLSFPYKGILIDLVNGMEDLKEGLIRPLHIYSFIDDPTRIFRGIRYKVRLNFEFSKEFFLALERCFEKSALKKLSGTRLANELKLYLNKEPEKNLEKLLKTTFNLNIFEKAGIKTEKNFFDSIVRHLKELKEELNNKEKEKFFLLSLVSPESLQNACRLGFSEPEIEKIKKHLEIIKELLEKWKKLSLWEKIKVFERIPVPYLLALSVYFPRIRKDVVNFLKKYRKIKPELTGDELIKLGVNEGKEIGRLLELLRKEKIEGKVKTKEDEKNFIAQFLLNKSKN
ncbi:MAG: CCA tRNA nucleotidyltransferase [Thermodesulfobacterium sp.]|nr:CCA tRNA nucleotidyltransferase [Thermodesulfobacterium sp.]